MIRTQTWMGRLSVAALAVAASITSLMAFPASPVGAAGILPPNNPATNILPAIPLACNNAINDTSAACTNSTLYDIDVGRNDEGLGPLILPSNYASLTVAGQDLALVNLERTARGLPLEFGLAPCLNGAAQTGADDHTDPIVDPVAACNNSPMAGYWGNWASTPTALESDFLLVYDDGLNSANKLCSLANTTDCWGHRDNILNSLCTAAQTSCTNVMGDSSSGQTAQVFGVYTGLGTPPGGDFSFVDSSIDYVTTATPQILSLGALSGSSGATLTVNGIYLTGATSVQFGSPSCTAVPTVVSDVQVTVTVPVCALGPVGLEVVTPSGSSNASLFTAEHADPYSPLPSPVRICDTRPNNPSGLSGDQAQCSNGNAGKTIPALGTLTINVASKFGVPDDATAVVLNVTAVAPAGPGFVTVFPAGVTMPTASNINYTPGEVVPNLVEAGIGTSGQVSFYSLARTDLVIDVEGYSAPVAVAGTGSGLYTPLPSPVRICDTRAGNPSLLNAPPVNQCNGATITPGGTRDVAVTGANAIPPGAIAAVLNVTVANPGGPGFLTVYPQGGQRPTASNVNYLNAQVTANRVIVPLSANGAITVYSSQSADVIVDVSGYYSAPSVSGAGSQFNAETAPVRICDTRSSSPANQCQGRTIGPGGTLTVPVIGLAASGVPVGATAVVINLTGIAPTQPTFLTLFAAPPRPTATSDLNPAVGEVRANLAVATLSHNGTISIYNSAGNIDVIVDVLGWYS
jgi:hypothetical protein